MHYYTTRYLFLTIVLAFTYLSSLGQGSEKYSVLLDVTVDASAPSITIHFDFADDALSYNVYRKEQGETSWGTSLTTITSGNSYTDANVKKDVIYEYFIQKNGDTGFKGSGYVTTGIDVAAMHERGALLILVDSALHSEITTELDVLMSDMAGDGYEVMHYEVRPGMDHFAVKAKIQEFKSMHKNLRNVLILGHVAVPYSGTYCEDSYWIVPPDGHREGVGNHCGAWPADVYYGVTDGNWTDEDTVFAGTRSFTENDKGDGKFDQIVLPGKVDYGIGRVDLSNLPKFPKSEVELTKQYIQKNHDYRHAISKPIKRALIDENFGANATESFGSNGYRNFGQIVGKHNVNTNDYMTTTKDTQYLVAYGSGPGSFTQAGNVGTTDNFVANDAAAYFNMLFGSFFGNWNVSNNFLRAPLAVEKGGLINAWAGRPNWHFYAMALNQNAGYCTQVTQNNTNTYTPGNFTNQIHVALMGDPSLRLHMFQPVQNFTGVSTDNGTKVDLQWTQHDDADGFYVYASKDKYGPYTLLNETPYDSKTTTMKINAPRNEFAYIMIRAARLEETHSGSFHNLSQGSIVKVENLVNTSVETLNQEVAALNVYPNPSEGIINVNYRLHSGNEARIEVLNMQGQRLWTTTKVGNGIQKERIDLSSFAKGLYLVRVNNSSQRILIK